jgi:hypothetical protein
MFGRKRNREAHRYYLLPGMGRSNRRHRQQTHVAAVIVGLVASAVIGGLLFWFNRR